MNTELIKELDKLGFKCDASISPYMSMTIKNSYEAFYSIDLDAFAIYTGSAFTKQLDGSVIIKPSIGQILSKIKEKLGFEFIKNHKSNQNNIIQMKQQMIKCLEDLEFVKQGEEERYILFLEHHELLATSSIIHLNHINLEFFFKKGKGEMSHEEATTCRSTEEIKKAVERFKSIDKKTAIDLVYEKNKESKFQDLFDFFVQEHDLYLTETGMEDIIQASKKHLQYNSKNETSTQSNFTEIQRIEELEAQNEVLNTKLQKIEDMVKDKSLKIDELEKKINQNQSLQSIEKIMEVFKEIQQLAITLKAQNEFPVGGVTDSQSAKVEGNENILSKSQLDNLVGKEPKFKVGDEVIIKKDIKIDDFKNGATGDIVDAQKASQVLKIESPIKSDGTYSFIINAVVLYLHENELEHAPKKNKELKLGGWAEVVGNTSKHGFEIGQKVLVGCFYEDIDQYVCLCEIDLWHCNTKDLKPL